MAASLRVKIPARLSPITHIDHDAEVDPRAAHLTPEKVKAVWRAVREMYRSRAYPAISFCLRRNGHIVLNRAIGHAYGNGPGDGPHERHVLMRPETPVCAFSATKAVTAILVHKLAEEGGLDLEQRVSHYLPQFAQQGKGQTTVSEVLSHRGGFPMFELPKEQIRPEMLLDWNACIEMICAAPPAHRNSPRMAYHAITGGFILGELIQRITGKPLADYLDTRLRQPLGMQHFTYGLPQPHRQTTAKNYCAGTPVRFPISKLLERALIVPVEKVVEVSNTDVFMDGVIPAGNLYCTAEELSRFYQMLLDGGVWGDKQVLEPQTVARAITPACKLQFDHTLKIPMRYSEGLMLGANPIGLYGPMSGRAYGHLGFMNILGWADPARNVSVGMMVTGKAVLGTHLIALGNLLTAVAWQCR